MNVNVNNPLEAYKIGSAFTPNNDGLNDCFGVSHWGNVKGFSFRIFNRYGEIVYYSNNSLNCWNGTYKGVMQNNGIYIYIIEADGVCGKVLKKGTFLLIK